VIDWDFTRPDQIAGLTSGLAASWKIDETDHTRWVFSLRDGVKFYDGSALTADAVIWNLDRIYNEKSLPIRCAGLGDRAVVRQHARSLPEDRRPHDCDLDEVALQLLHLHDPDDADRQPDVVGKGGPQLDRVRQGTVGDRTVSHYQGGTGPIRRDELQRLEK
jgi:hypothetical protein